MDHMKNIYKILRTIDYCFNNDIPLNFDLEKLGINENQLGLYLYNLTNDSYIEGILYYDSLKNPKHLCYRIIDPITLTIDGMIFLEENSTMKILFNTLKETKDWLALLKPF